LAVFEKGERYLEVDEVYVHQEYRSKNIGHLLVDKLLQTSEGNGITRSVVYSATKQWQKIVGFMRSTVLRCGLFKCIVEDGFYPY
jgi:N-acetylglutamate synthase-like GNAT family acetyltransferase